MNYARQAVNDGDGDGDPRPLRFFFCNFAALSLFSKIVFIVTLCNINKHHLAKVLLLKFHLKSDTLITILIYCFVWPLL